MYTKKEYIAPKVKVFSYRTEDGFYNTAKLQLDFFQLEDGMGNQETWEEDNTTLDWNWN